MEVQRDTSEWQQNAAIRVSQLAVMMHTEFSIGFDAEQTDRYWQLYDEYMQLQCDRKEHNRFIDPLYKERHMIG